MDHKIVVGLAPTRRNIFSKEEALKQKRDIQAKLRAWKVEFVDIEDVNGEGLLFQESDVAKTVAKFKAAGVHAAFFPHVNFGTEDLVCKVAKELNVPVLLWAPQDKAPEADGSRLTDSQCGLFATGKILRRFHIPFTYIVNCPIDDVIFERGFKNFLAAANVVKEFKKLRILQISTRPQDFWTMMCNEGELLEKFGIQIVPVPMPELTRNVKAIEKENGDELKKTIAHIRENMEICVSEEGVTKVAALKCAMKNMAEEKGCSAIAIQCWNELQSEIGLFPCTANSLLTDEGIPVVCETDIHGAITSVITQAAGMGKTPSFFADWTIRHPEDKNGELLQHCGPWPISLAKKGRKPKLTTPFAFASKCPGSCSVEVKGGEMSILRFDGDGGRYSLLLGKAEGIEGPANHGTYVWIRVKNWPRLEKKLVEGPYVHHCVGIHADVLPVLYEAAKYIGVELDFYDDDAEEKVLQYLLNE